MHRGPRVHDQLAAPGQALQGRAFRPHPERCHRIAQTEADFRPAAFVGGHPRPPADGLTEIVADLGRRGLVPDLRELPDHGPSAHQPAVCLPVAVGHLGLGCHHGFRQHPPFLRLPTIRPNDWPSGHRPTRCLLPGLAFARHGRRRRLLLDQGLVDSFGQLRHGHRDSLSQPKAKGPASPLPLYLLPSVCGHGHRVAGEDVAQDLVRHPDILRLLRLGQVLPLEPTPAARPHQQFQPEWRLLLVGVEVDVRLLDLPRKVLLQVQVCQNVGRLIVGERQHAVIDHGEAEVGGNRAPAGKTRANRELDLLARHVVLFVRLDLHPQVRALPAVEKTLTQRDEPLAQNGDPHGALPPLGTQNHLVGSGSQVHLPNRLDRLA